ncbi:hypothetical protein LOAG_11787 [Loa loa]|uniref:Uncharacterized protein n=1 Tax=Loa loa TaxID=7209 RepID=A0A1S0TNX8_LOALO|nr:hypothetical protein LOAG_11787 [Loa loa]EFO16717.1 hypothetical protein LOAG_11787 [Loa loa]
MGKNLIKGVTINFQTRIKLSNYYCLQSISWNNSKMRRFQSITVKYHSCIFDTFKKLQELPFLTFPEFFYIPEFHYIHCNYSNETIYDLSSKVIQTNAPFECVNFSLAYIYVIENSNFVQTNTLRIDESLNH